MPQRRHTKESVIQTLQNLAKQLGKKTLSKSEINRVIPESSVSRLFGSLGNALEASGLERFSREHYNRQLQVARISTEDLFQSLLECERKLNHEPTFNEYAAHGSHSIAPLRRRFGKWSDALTHYRKWKMEGGHTAEKAPDKEGLQIPVDGVKPVEHPTNQQAIIPARSYTGRKAPEQLYGEPIDFRGLRHAPINEQGVVYLFGMVSRELGFYIESVQQGFPDCEGKVLHDAKKNLWAKARIEFEYKASNFQEHGHDPAQCDFIVCWISDWPDCPIDVIELKSEILKLPS